MTHKADSHQASKLRATEDHVLPRSRGGHRNRHNIVLACQGCNSRKGQLSLVAFLIEEGAYLYCRRFGVSGKPPRPANLNKSLTPEKTEGNEKWTTQGNAAGTPLTQ